MLNNFVILFFQKLETIPEHDESFPRATPDSETEVRTELITGDGQKDMANELSTALADKQLSEHHQSQVSLGSGYLYFILVVFGMFG